MLYVEWNTLCAVAMKRGKRNDVPRTLISRQKDNVPAGKSSSHSGRKCPGALKGKCIFAPLEAVAAANTTRADFIPPMRLLAKP